MVHSENTMVYFIKDVNEWNRGRYGQVNNVNKMTTNGMISNKYLYIFLFQIPEVMLWSRQQNEEKSPNLTMFTEHFNKMSYW